MNKRFKVQDHFFKKAKSENFLARSVYKLEEVDKKFKIFKKAKHVIDLGYHPGSWVQYASKKIPNDGKIIGIDIKPVNEKLIGGNIDLYERDVFTVDDLRDLGLEAKVDVVLSDMAPNTSGVKSLDQIRSLELVEKIFNLFPVLLREGGRSVIKIFDSQEARVFIKERKGLFEKYAFYRPESTRTSSKEFFLVCIGHRPAKGKDYSL